MKLYSAFKEEVELPKTISNISTESESIDSFDTDSKDLTNNIKAYRSLSVVEEQMTLKNFSLVDKSNYVLYNEYIKAITANLNVSNIPVISQETIRLVPEEALTRTVALEGFIKDIWEKIKALFKKIYNTIKEFMTRWFTTLGRLKGKLKNLSEALDETDKDIATTELEKVPSGIAKRFPFKGVVTPNMVEEVLSNTKTLVTALGSINSVANKLANKDMVDKDLIEKIKKLEEEIKKKSEFKDAYDKTSADAKKGFGAVKALIPGTDTNSKVKEVKEGSGRLSDEIKKSQKEIDTEIDNVKKTVKANEVNLSLSDDELENKLKKEISDFTSAIVAMLEKEKGKKLINGLVIKNVTNNNGLELETENEKETPSGVILSNKSNLKKMVVDTIKMIEEAEKLTSGYGKINDMIIKKIDEADKIMNSIDKLNGETNETFTKYKNVLSNVVKNRLMLMKEFFNDYNKVSKNVYGMGLDCGDGVVNYTVTCLKYFG